MCFRKAIWALVFLLSAVSLEAAGRQFLRGHVPEAVVESKAVGRVAADTRLSVAVGLPLRNQDALNQFLTDVSNPASVHFRQYLTPAEFAERFGPTEDDYQKLTAFFEANGLEISGTHSNRTILDITGSISAIENTFHVAMMNWEHPVRGTFFAPDREPSLDAEVAILDVTGLDNFVLPHPMDLQSRPFASTSETALTSATPLTTGSGPAGLFIGGDYRAAYAPSVTLSGTGQAVGLFELDGFYAADVTANFKQAGLTPVPVQTVLLDGFSGSPGSANVEVILDIMMASYMAPGASKIIVYEGTNWNDVLNRMATDNLASQLSSSWCFSPTNATTEQIFRQMIAQGQSLFQASGDSGAYKGAIMPPSDDPNVTVVGGTSLTTASAGGAWKSETTWSGSGGGVSTVWPIPSYQQAVNVAAAGGSKTMRNIPDVALLADIQIFLICNNGQAIEVGGTSAAAPLWAGFVALANQQAVANKKPTVGFMNPLLYAIGAGTAYQIDLHDITTGNDGGFNALPGYDLATGWGTPAGQTLINALTSTTTAAGFGLASSSATLSIAPGASGVSTITVSAQQGFSGAVALTASGLPTGVTATFSPSSATTTSTLTLTAAGSAAPSTSTVTITGTSGSLTETARMTLTVTGTPSFALSATPASVSVAQGGLGISSIAVSPQNGFTGSVTLAASGLPPGVTAAFSSATTTTSRTLTLSAVNSAAPGTYAVTITGTSGSLQETATVSLTVTSASGFAMAAAPSSASVGQGASVTSIITVTQLGTFSSTVGFAATGLPTGVTATFTTESATHVSTVTFKAAPNATLGAAAVTITGTAGSITNKTTIALTVTAPASFTLTSTPASVSIGAGASGISVIVINAQNGFNAPVVLAATGLPTGVTAIFSAVASGASTLTLAAASSAAATTAMVKITGASGTLSATTTIALTVTLPPSFNLAAAPTALSIAQGASGVSTLTLSAQNGFSGAVTVSLSGLPTGVTGIFSAGTTATSCIITLTAASSATTGASTITITGKSGSMTKTAAVSLTVTAAAATPGVVNLAPSYNVMGAVTDGAAFLSNSGLDGGGRAYSSNLLSTVVTASGAHYNFGPANAPGAVSGTTIALPSGKYSTLTLLATGVNGNQTGQIFTVTYTDGTTSTFTQSLSDWCTPQNYTGESKAVPMTYRDLSNGTRDTRALALYGYTFNLSNTKTVKSIALPQNRNVVVMAMSLVGASNSTAQAANAGEETFSILIARGR